ncbi:MAG TPA: hypothetical protein VEK08_08650 [Planctomycetota bacterium]|nr:hypothetical protein [Planctomycetota bacterium]
MNATRNSLSMLALALLPMFAGCEKKSAEQAQSEKRVDAIEQVAEKGPVKMLVRIWPKHPRLSDMLDMEITLESQPDVDVKPPAFGQGVGDFVVRDYIEKAPTQKDGKSVRHLHYKLEPTLAGKHLIRSIAIEFVDKRPNSEGKAEPVLLETEPLEILVTSELGDQKPSLTELAPMQPPRPLPPAPIWYWLAGAGALAALIAGAVLLKRRMKKAPEAVVIRRSPEEIAHAELKALLAENLHGRGEFRDFYVGLTGIVRRYIEGTTGLRAPEQTTEEFLRDMQAKKVYPDERSRQLAHFLEAADMVKYAAQLPGQRQIEESIARAQEFIGMSSALRPMPEAVLK